MNESRQSVHPLMPALQACASVFGALLVFYLMLDAARWWETDEDLSEGYSLWAGAISISIVIWFFILIAGVRANGAAGRLDRSSRWRVFASLLLLGVLAWAVTRFLALMGRGDGTSEWSDPFRTLVSVVTALAFISASPWLLLVWTTHGRLGELRMTISRIITPRPDDEFDPRIVDARRVRSAIGELDAIWRTVERSSLAIGLLLSTVVVDTAFLRMARIAAGTSPDDFPGWTVVGYGAFFALVLVLILTPVLIGWREDGMRLVEKALGEPRSGVPSTSQREARARLLMRIGLDRPTFLRPITLLSVLAPFLTGFVTSLIPA